MLPIAAAHAIQMGIGFGRVAGDVWQIKQGGNTGATANERGNKEHVFEGVLKLEPGEIVVLVDDTFTSGSTLTALFDYLHGQGIKAEHIFALASGRYTKDVAATLEKQKAALDKIGVDAATFERATGTPINAFTGAELHGYTLNGKPGIAGFLDRFDAKGISGSARVLRGSDAGLGGELSRAPAPFSLAPSGAYIKGGLWYHGGPVELEGGRLIARNCKDFAFCGRPLKEPMGRTGGRGNGGCGGKGESG